MERGFMENKSIRCLINGISRFIHLISCQTSMLMPSHKDFERVAMLMKHLNPFLDEVVGEKISPDGIFLKECEKLDTDVKEATDCIERWSSNASKILSVWQSELVLNNIRSSLFEICRMFCRLLRASLPSSSLASLHNCMQELQNWQPNRISTHIEQALSYQNDKSISRAEHLIEIIESLGLISNQELLEERIKIEKERLKAQAQANHTKGDIDIYQVVDLIYLICDFMLESGYLNSSLGFSIPSGFRCPLSLELMLDPVIVASGRTFERACIQEWIIQGLNTCPKTREPLSHTSFIPNHTMKAMIVSWFEENNLELPTHQTPNIIHTDSFHGSPYHSNTTSMSSVEFRDLCAVQTAEDPFVCSKDGSRVCNTKQIKKAGFPEHSYTHSRTQSASSAVSSYGYPPTATDVSKVSNQLEKFGIFSETKSECFTPRTSTSASFSSKSSMEMPESSKNNSHTRTNSFASSDMGSDETTTISYVEKLVEDLKSDLNKLQISAACELRLLAKHNVKNRNIIGNCGAISPLVGLVYSEVKIIQEHAVTALLNLSINDENKAMIAEAGVLEPLIHVLKSGNDAAKENSAAALFSLAANEEFKIKLGRSEAVKGLVNLLGTGTVRGKKDAATALFHLSISHENKALIVQAGAIKYLVELLEHDSGFVDKAIALLANLASVSEGRSAIVQEGGIPMIVEILECGSRRGKENAASILLQVCLNSNKFCSMVLQEGSVPPLVALSQTGTSRAREKAQQLLSHFRSQRRNDLSSSNSDEESEESTSANVSNNLDPVQSKDGTPKIRAIVSDNSAFLRASSLSLQLAEEKLVSPLCSKAFSVEESLLGMTRTFLLGSPFSLAYAIFSLTHLWTAENFPSVASTRRFN
ncbi:hypothetical protein V2J09_003223 [Rumex salicifolius]